MYVLLFLFWVILNTKATLEIVLLGLMRRHDLYLPGPELIRLTIAGRYYMMKIQEN